MRALAIALKAVLPVFWHAMVPVLQTTGSVVDRPLQELMRAVYPVDAIVTEMSLSHRHAIVVHPGCASNRISMGRSCANSQDRI